MAQQTSLMVYGTPGKTSGSFAGKVAVSSEALMGGGFGDAEVLMGGPMMMSILILFMIVGG
ncbi:MAG TPA: hypothetical protein ENH85_08195 [Candidatus Scalindua sp.]|nr:hypothetical protein [Candidatus Scalindua sp.]